MNSLNSENKDMLDVVDENEIVIGSKSRNDVHRLGLLHREIHVFLFDKDHNIYFQKRDIKKSSGGLLDASIGGHVDKGEDYLTAAIREAKEESGLLILPSDLILLIKFKNPLKNDKKGTINNFIRSVYIYKNPITDKQIKEDSNETDGFQKFSPDFLSNLSEKDMLLFCKFVPTYELTYVLNYIKNI